MLYACALFWAHNDPAFQQLPLVASVGYKARGVNLNQGVLGTCGTLYFVGIALLWRKRNGRTWIPYVSDYKI